MEFGGLRGLTFNTGQDKLIEDLKYFDQQARQNEAMNMAKAKMFADDIEFQTASNPFDAALVKQEGEQLLTELGKIRSENPNWNTDPNVLALMKFKKQGLKSSPAVLRSMAYKQAMEDYTKDLAAAQQSPDEYDVEALNQFEIQRKNYEQFGHPMGAEAAKKEGYVPLVYKAPQKFVDLDKLHAEVGSKIVGNKYRNPTGNLGSVESYVEDKDLLDYAKNVYKSRKRQYDVQWGGSEEDIVKGIADKLKLHYKREFNIGDPDAYWRRGIEKRKLDLMEGKAQSQANPEDEYTTWDDFTNEKIPAGNVPVDLVRSIWNDKPQIVIRNNKGDAVDLTGFDAGWTGKYVKVDGIPYLLGNIDIPIEAAEKMGIYSDPIGPNLGRTGKITSDFVGKAELVDSADKDGNAVKFVRVKHQFPINPKDQTAKQKWESWSNPAKLVTPSEDPYKQKSSIPNGTIVIDKKTGKKYRKVEGGYEPM